MFSRWLFLCALNSVLASWMVAAADEKILYERTSRYNTILVTEDGRGLRALRFERGGVRQSVTKVGDPDHIELPYARVMPVGLAVVDKPRRVLIVGLGGGTIPNFLHKHYPQMKIDVVDIDPDVIEVATRYFGFRQNATMRAYAEDGRRFIENCRNRYDVIFLDAYGSDSIPYHLATREFLRSVFEALTEQGIVVGNVWSRESNPLYDSMVRTYQDVFGSLYILDVRGAGNKILLALPGERRIEREELASRARKLSQQHGFRFDMGDSVEYGFRDIRGEGSPGQILTDKVSQPETDRQDGSGQKPPLCFLCSPCDLWFSRRVANLGDTLGG